MEDEELEASAGATPTLTVIVEVVEVEASAPPQLLFPPPALEPEESCSRSVARRLRAASIERKRVERERKLVSFSLRRIESEGAKLGMLTFSLGTL